MAKIDREGRNGGKLNSGLPSEQAREAARKPRKGLSMLNAELLAEGEEPVSAADYQATLLHLLNLTEERMRGLLDRKDTPAPVKIMIRNLLDGVSAMSTLEKIADRAFGKPTQKQELSGPDGGAVTFVLQAPEGIEVNIKQDD